MSDIEDARARAGARQDMRGATANLTRAACLWHSAIQYEAGNREQYETALMEAVSYYKAAFAVMERLGEKL